MWRRNQPLSSHHHILDGVSGNLLDSQPIEALFLILLACPLAAPPLRVLYLGSAPGNQGQVLEPVVDRDPVLVNHLPVWGDASTVALPGGKISSIFTHHPFCLNVAWWQSLTMAFHYSPCVLLYLIACTFTQTHTSVWTFWAGENVILLKSVD